MIPSYDMGQWEAVSGTFTSTKLSLEPPPLPSCLWKPPSTKLSLESQSPPSCFLNPCCHQAVSGNPAPPSSLWNSHLHQGISRNPTSTKLSLETAAPQCRVWNPCLYQDLHVKQYEFKCLQCCLRIDSSIRIITTSSRPFRRGVTNPP